MTKVESMTDYVRILITYPAAMNIVAYYLSSNDSSFDKSIHRVVEFRDEIIFLHALYS